MSATSIREATSEELQADWDDRSDRLWYALREMFDGSHPGAAYFEQLAWRSYDEKRCHRCGDRGTVRQERSMLAQAVPHYWLCDECWLYGVESIGGEIAIWGLA